MKTGYGIQDTGFKKSGDVRSDTVLPRSSLHPASCIPYPVSRILYPALLALCIPLSAQAGAQKEEQLSASVRSMMQRAVSDQAAPKLAFSSQQEAQLWLDDMSQRLAKRIPDANYRFDLLSTVHYEATRAGLDPHMVLGLIEVESGFRKYAVSKSGARGYMQVMPFWTKSIGSKDQNLFHLRTNLRYGCTILRYYLDMEKGDLYRALGRYNGSLGKPEYPNMVKAAWHKHWNKPQRNNGLQSG